jgi:hypothetical protein
MTTRGEPFGGLELLSKHKFAGFPNAGVAQAFLAG